MFGTTFRTALHRCSFPRTKIARLSLAATGLATCAAATTCHCDASSFDSLMKLVEVKPDCWEWAPRDSPAGTPQATEAEQAGKHLQPVVSTPVTVVSTAGITIREYFGNVASHFAAASFALASVHRADEAGFQTPQFSEYVIVTSGTLSLQTVDATGAALRKTDVTAGQGVYLPAGLRVKWSWPAPCTYTVVCIPAFSPEAAGSDATLDAPEMVVDHAARRKLTRMHQATAPPPSPPAASHDAPRRELAAGVTPLVVDPVAVVEAPGITILEHFGHVASSDGVASLGRASVKGASQEAWQAPGFDEFVVCTSGSIEFRYGNGEVASIAAGQGIFLPKHLRVKWVWPEATEYTVLCLPAFTPALSGREAEENATNAKDSTSMKRLQELHKKTA